jgi:MSHA pilin protein MshA
MKAKGFTLIELVVVIVLLGILAATAAPKFINLSAEARTSTLQAVKASMQGAAGLVYSKSLVKGNQREINSTITITDGELFIRYGYPRANMNEWKRLIDIDENFDYKTFGTSSLNVLVIFRRDSPEPTNAGSPCMVFYLEPTVPNTPPRYELNKCE